MKKLKLNTAKLQLKKGTIVSLTAQQMRQVYGGETGPCTTYPCETAETVGCIPANECGGNGTNFCPTQTCPSDGYCHSDIFVDCQSDFACK